MRKYLLLVVDTGQDSAFQPILLGAFDTKEQAENECKKDINRMVQDAEGMKVEFNYDTHVVSVDDGKYGAVWSIEELVL